MPREIPWSIPRATVEGNDLLRLVKKIKSSSKNYTQTFCKCFEMQGLYSAPSGSCEIQLSWTEAPCEDRAGLQHSGTGWALRLRDLETPLKIPTVSVVLVSTVPGICLTRLAWDAAMEEIWDERCHLLPPREQWTWWNFASYIQAAFCPGCLVRWGFPFPAGKQIVFFLISQDSGFWPACLTLIPFDKRAYFSRMVKLLKGLFDMPWWK